ncbi:MAG: hypothetical protein LQ349_002003 [Xanthoria aureola]|nr:MAG: hypothetical protein LQ349_002003 [Xanthoria aureola]
MASTTIPTLDFARFREGSALERQTFSEQLLAGFVRYGFVKVVNHGIEDHMIQGIFDQSKEFFEMPERLKLKAEHPPRPDPHRGWSRVGKEKLAGITGFQKGVRNPKIVDDAKESFDIGSNQDPLFPNIWPDEEDLPVFKDFTSSYFEQCHEVHMGILRCIELALHLTEGRLESLCCANHTELRLTHYPEIDVGSLRGGKRNRITEHTDFGTITLLWQDSTGGLEVEDPLAPGVYIPVETKHKSEMVVNIGDTLQRWTNDTLCSVNHRVTIPVSMRDHDRGMLPARTSIAFFGKANRDASLRCLSEFSRDRPPRFDEDVTALEYNQRMVEKTY